MKNVGIFLIARDAEDAVKYTMESLDKDAGELTDKYKFYLTMYENDSVDDTIDVMTDTPLKNISRLAVSEQTNFQKFGSVVSRERIDVMAACRTKCMDAFYRENGGIDLDFVVWVDVDYVFHEECLKNILNAVDEDDIADIASVYSIHGDIQKAPMELYDKWATRAKETDNWWGCPPYRLMPEVAEVYATYNGMCAFKAGPFNDGLRFKAESKHQPKLDVEHISVCEGFKDAGLDRVVILRDSLSVHFANPANIQRWLDQGAQGFQRQ